MKHTDRQHSAVDTQYQQALALHHEGQLAKASALYDAILAAHPDYADTLHLRGVLAHQSKEFELAVRLIGRAVAINPHNAAYHSNLGIALGDGPALEAALQSLDQAIAINPDYAQAYSNKGLLLARSGQLARALAYYDKAIALQPDYADAHMNRAHVLMHLQDYAAAIASYDHAIASQADPVKAHLARCCALLNQNQLEQAISGYDWVIAIAPQHADAYFAKAIALLTLGDFAQAWPLHEWRWKMADFPSPNRNFKQPLWLGHDDLAGKTVLLHAEQGLGDTMQFCRYAKLVAQRGARVIMEVQPGLVGLLRTLDPQPQLVAKGALLPDFDYHCPLLSLPLAFNTSLADVPSAQAYLSSEPAKVSQWVARLGAKDRPRVGIAWSGNTEHKNDSNRSMGFAEFMAHLPPGFQYVSLQQQVRESDRAALQARTDVVHFGSELTSFAETAALCDLMDVVVCVDTAVAHLSAALGKPTWVLLPFSPDWRWMLGRDDSPWYPSMRLYRQADIGDWSHALRRLGQDLQQTLGTATQAQGVAGTGKPVVPPFNAQEKFQRAFVLHLTGQTEQASVLYDEIVAQDANHANAWHMRGLIALQANDFDQAIRSIKRAIAIDASNPAFHLNIGIAQDKTQAFDAALRSFDKAISLKADYAQAYSNKGLTLSKCGDLALALSHFDTAIALRPDFAEAHVNRGHVFMDRKDPSAALACYDRAISSQADCLDAHLARSVALCKVNRLEESIASCDWVIARAPNHAEAQFCKSIALLALGDLPQGLALYEWRWKCERHTTLKRNFDQPLWLGQRPLAGRTILLHDEQGFGDTLQFCRYAKLLDELGAHVILEVQAPLVGLLRSLPFTQTLIAKGAALPPFDYHCPLLSLPLAFNTHLADVPSAQSYLSSEPGKVSLWAARLGAKDRPRVGIAWSGNTEHKNDSNRSMGFAEFMAHLPPGFQYVSLQQQVRESDRAALQARTDVVHFGSELTSFAETAALCDLMDVVVCVDTAVAHLSAALGKPTWVLLPFSPDWRWMLGRDDSPWYPSMRLYRQADIGDWSHALRRLGQDLQQTLGTATQVPGVAEADKSVAPAAGVPRRVLPAITPPPDRTVQQREATARQHFDAGHYQQAAQCQIEVVNALEGHPPRQAQALRFMARIAFALADFTGALTFFDIAAKKGGLDGHLLESIGACHTRLGNLEQARLAITQAQQWGHRSINMLAGLAEVCGRLGRRQEAAAAGTEALIEKARLAPATRTLHLPAARQAFDAAKPERNIIAWSLWGAMPQYTQGAILNVRRARVLFAGWTPRFYVDDTVPADVLATLRREGAQIVQRPRAAKPFSGALWRFEVAFDPSVDFFLVRDCDSLLNLRDRFAVQAWLESDRHFHVMRDHCGHTDLVLAGLWGGVGNILPALQPEIAAFCEHTPNLYGVDQQFLGHVVWPLIGTHALVHDSWFNMPGSQPFPADATVYDEPHLGYKTTFQVF